MGRSLTIPLPEPTVNPQRRAVSWPTVFAGIVVIGAGLRLAQYLSNQPYWNDEASLVLNIYNKTAAELMGPLDYAQASPPLFLLALRGIHVALGRSELAMRLLPLLLSIAALIVFARLVQITLPNVIAAITLSLFALSDHLIAHAAEAKQYSGDACIAAILLLAVIQDADRIGPDRRLLRAGLITTPAIWFSHPATFVFAGIAFALLPDLIRSVTMRSLPRILLAVLAPAISFLLLYLVSIRHQQYAMLFEYWSARFVDFADPMRLPWWLIRSVTSLFSYSYEMGGPILAPLAIVGTIHLWRTGRRELLGVLVLPILLTLLAAALRRYPFGGTRLTLFLVPSCLLLAGFGLDVAARELGTRIGRWWWILAGGLIAINAVIDVHHVITPRHRGNMRAVVQTIRQHRAELEHVYVAREHEREFLCYWTNPDRRIHLGPWPAQFDGKRFWIALSFGPKGSIEEELPPALRSATPAQSLHFRGGAALLYESGKLDIDEHKAKL